MSLVGGIGNVMNAAGGGGSAEDMMAAAVAAIDMEDDFEEAGISGGKVREAGVYASCPGTALLQCVWSQLQHSRDV